jgi:uroporphyrinogen-III synthase
MSPAPQFVAKRKSERKNPKRKSQTLPDPKPNPLKGKRVIVTRAIEQTADLSARLTAQGAIPISLPLVSFAPPENYAPLDAALDQLNSFDWIIFTSANAVHSVTSRANEKKNANLSAPDKDAQGTSTSTPSLASAAQHTPVILRLPDEGSRRTSTPTVPTNFPQIAAVGPATAAALVSAGLHVTYTAKTHLGVALADELGDHLRQKSVFLPRSDRANLDLPAALRKLGAKLTEVIAYRTIPPTTTDQSSAISVLDDHEADAILFFSPSAVHNFADLAGRDRLVAAQNKIAVVAVGPITTRALHQAGVTRVITAADTSTASVVDALANHFANAQAGATIR